MLVPRTDNRIKPVLHKIRCGSILFLLIMVFPVGNDDTAVKQIECRGGIVILTVCNRHHLSAREIRRRNQFVVPDDRTAAVGADILGQFVYVFCKQLVGNTTPAFRTGRKRIGLVKSEMKITAVTAQIIEFSAHFGKQLFRIGV